MERIGTNGNFTQVPLLELHWKVYQCSSCLKMQHYFIQNFTSMFKEEVSICASKSMVILHARSCVAPLVFSHAVPEQKIDDNFIIYMWMRKMWKQLIKWPQIIFEWTIRAATIQPRWNSLFSLSFPCVT